MEFIIILSAVLLAVAAEIAYDKWCWKQDPRKDDKPISTIGRLLVLSGISLATYYIFDSVLWINFLIVFSIHTFLFDQTLNIFRWKVLSGIKNLSYNHKVAHELHMTKFEKITWSIKQFMVKLFYHGTNPKPWTWDFLFNRIPGLGELLFKSAFLLTGIIKYFNLY